MGAPSEARERRTRRWLLLLAALVFVALRLPYLSLPLDRDEGEYAYIAWRILEGDVPYRDAFDQKPPAIFAAYLGVFATLGRSAEAIHGLAALWSALTAWLLYAVVARLGGALAGACAVLVFAAIAAHPALGATAANTELFLLLPAVASFLALLRGLASESPKWWLLCGAMGVLACWFKQVAATNFAFVLAVAALTQGSPPRAGAAADGVGAPARAARRLGWIALGAAAAVLPVLGVFAAADALEPFIDAVFLHNLEYAGRRTLGQGLDNLFGILLHQAPALIGVWLLALAGLLHPAAASGKVRALIGGWLLSSLLGASVGLQFRPHYFVQTLPPLCALAGLGLAALVRRALCLEPRALGALALAGLAVALLLPPLLAQRDSLFASSPAAASRALYGWNPFAVAPEIARHIAGTSASDETVYVVGSEPELLFQAERRSATRYIFFYPLTGGGPRAASRQREAMQEVRAARPGYVVVVDVSTSLLASDETDPWIFQATDQLLADEYRLELLARPDDAQQSYVLEYGADALRWLRRQRSEPDALPLIEVYRRMN